MQLQRALTQMMPVFGLHISNVPPKKRQKTSGYRNGQWKWFRIILHHKYQNIFLSADCLFILVDKIECSSISGFRLINILVTLTY